MGNKEGVCTGYLNRIYKKSLHTQCIRGFIKPSEFVFPTDTSIPMIMVGVGCGIAPFIGYIGEREYLMKTKKDANYGSFELYFGCRYREKDFIYKRELQRWKEEGVLSALHLAFSRDQKEKVYVQNLMKEDAKRLSELITKQQAIISICGSIKMGEEVRKTVLDIIGIEVKESERYLEEMERTGRFVIELWD